MTAESYPWMPEKRTSGERVVRALARRSSLLWGLAIVTFGVGDVLTTAVGLWLGAVETHPLGELVLDAAGTPGMIAWKALTITAFVGLAYSVPREWRVGVPIGVALWGTIVTAWNLLVLARLF